MSHPIDRRHFLGVAASAGLSLGLPLSGAGAEVLGANDKLLVGVMGMGGRGRALAQAFAQEPGVEVAYVCDVDATRTLHAVEELNTAVGKAPKAVADYRRMLEDTKVNLLVVATCNHWHAPATIAACVAGKHVYVEKPCSHNPHEGELMVQAARKHDRLVQMGVQRRSWPTIIEAVQHVRNGVIGRAYFARALYSNNRPSIGRGQQSPVPDQLDYELWQGPAPRRAFQDNYLHYNWHWFWHWGNGELGNNGVHFIDICRYGLEVDYPVRVTSAGGRYRYQDDQETPDSQVATFEFEGGKSIVWEGLSCVRAPDNNVADVVFYGESGSLAIRGGSYVIYDVDGKEVRAVDGSAGDREHLRNFISAVRDDSSLTCEIEEGYKSTLLCHLGNIAYRTGQALRCDPATGRILDNAEALALWQRQYEPGWEPHV